MNPSDFPFPPESPLFPFLSNAVTSTTKFSLVLLGVKCFEQMLLGQTSLLMQSCPNAIQVLCYCLSWSCLLLHQPPNPWICHKKLQEFASSRGVNVDLTPPWGMLLLRCNAHIYSWDCPWQIHCHKDRYIKISCNDSKIKCQVQFMLKPTNIQCLAIKLMKGT